MKKNKIITQLIETSASNYERSGWHHYPCPFCDDKGSHMGVHVEQGRFHCFRCDVSGRMGASVATDILHVPRRAKKGHSRASGDIWPMASEITTNLDVDVYTYMKERGAGDMKLGWRLGRGWGVRVCSILCTGPVQPHGVPASKETTA